jgi:uroporphyrinogen decarboxylase
MLPKSHIKACLAGEPAPVVPAYLFWFDEKFIRQHEADVQQMRASFSDDFVQCYPVLEKRAVDPELEPGEFTDEWGCLFRGAPDGVGAHPTRPIITCVDDWTRYMSESIPLLNPDTATIHIKDAVERHPDHYVLAAFWRTFYERMYMLAGFENLMIEIALNGPVFSRMLNVLRDFTIRGIELIAETGVDGIFLADDWGTQHRLQISPDMWRAYFKPAYAAMIETAHTRGLDVWLHSCGNITEIIPELIDINLDVIGHLQTAALDLPTIAEAYRGQITFFGGIDVQYTIVDGTRQDVRDEVQAMITNFHAFDGRYIASPSNTIMPETPVENVRALFEAIREFGHV